MDLTRLQKRLKSLDSLPEKDKYRPLKDFHTINATGFYGKDLIYRTFDKEDPLALKDVTKPDDVVPQGDRSKTFPNGFIAVRKYFRNNAKAPGLALMYGGTSKVLENHFKVNRNVGLKMFISFFKELKVLKQHLQDRVERAKKNLYVENLFGRRLYLPQLTNKKTQHIGINKVYNSPIQGTASELIKIAILKSSQWIERYHLSRYSTNLVAKMVKGELYSRIVIIDEKIAKRRSTIKLLESLGNGHTKILVEDNNGDIVQEFDRNVQLSYYAFEKIKGRIAF